ncbi:concanavalin A-like lectin/glucanase domain-containing protein [Ilyonectria robusta]|uniref:concanavalin A-like lectin/glucanase domain-containing protein n=1 Tax=Ilyonectria robusta TaxID=1079257 RepID=UPI001E8D7B25|nr:concanavalin A-like lectin/glucanase domain-containing protein [Ilyonectria robusta]KAH8714185.1 concanavalin A-like lectin/glucanase domain-containing protein [Ilyonectria robusta]
MKFIIIGDSEATGGYTIYNNLWGQAKADLGNHCATNSGLTNDDSVAWSVDWTWSGGDGHGKSYPNYGFVIWLDALDGAGPISATGSSVATVTLADNSRDAHQDTNSQMTVFSFVRIQTVGAGTKPFTGNNVVFATTTLPGLNTRA